MRALLQAQIDTAKVMQEIDEVGHVWARNWMAAYSQAQWQAQFQAAFYDYAPTDLAKFMTWLNASQA